MADDFDEPELRNYDDRNSKLTLSRFGDMSSDINFSYKSAIRYNFS